VCVIRRPRAACAPSASRNPKHKLRTAWEVLNSASSHVKRYLDGGIDVAPNKVRDDGTGVGYKTSV
jgi:hypothetical protein